MVVGVLWGTAASVVLVRVVGENPSQVGRRGPMAGHLPRTSAAGCKHLHCADAGVPPPSKKNKPLYRDRATAYRSSTGRWMPHTLTSLMNVLVFSEWLANLLPISCALRLPAPRSAASIVLVVSLGVIVW